MEPTAHAHTLAVSGLPDQAELLAFASALENEVGVVGIALVRADGALGVFSVLSPSRDDLIEACRSVQGFDVMFDERHAHWDCAGGERSARHSP